MLGNIERQRWHTVGLYMTTRRTGSREWFIYNTGYKPSAAQLGPARLNGMLGCYRLHELRRVMDLAGRGLVEMRMGGGEAQGLE